MKKLLISSLILLTFASCSNNEDVLEDVLNETLYHVEVLTLPEQIIPNKEEKFEFQIITNNGEIQKVFEIMHEKLMHLVIVRKDLQEFQHLHPTIDPKTGIATANITFPTSGPYRMFFEFTPEYQSSITLDIDIGGNTSFQPQELEISKEATQKIGDYEVTYNFPKIIKTNEEIEYSLEVQKNSQPVTDLENYLGAKGHSIILKEGSLIYVHTHPKNNEDLTFGTNFTEPGKYKIFTQFQHNGKIMRAEYVVEVVENTDLEKTDSESAPAMNHPGH
ncbi:MAG: hypothetical protein AAB373_04925 [Patescibacteria group bacterium]